MRGVQRGREAEGRRPEGFTLGRIIATMRSALGWNQGELAAVAGVSSGTVSQWETGGRDPLRRNAEKLFDAMGEELALTRDFLDRLQELHRRQRLAAGGTPAPLADSGRALSNRLRRLSAEFTELADEVDRLLEGMAALLSGAAEDRTPE